MNRQHPKPVKPLRKGKRGITAATLREPGLQLVGDYPKAKPFKVPPQREISISIAAAKQEGLL
jgi:hypothetical protein